MKKHKLLRSLLVGVASLALIVPLGISKVSASSTSLSYAQVEHILNKTDEESEPAWKAQDEKYRPILKGYHGNMDDAYYNLDGYYSILKHQPWILDNLGRNSRVSPRWWVDHGGFNGVDEMNNTVRNAINRPKGYHGPNSLRGVPFGYQRKHHTKRYHIRHHRTRRNRKHAVRRHNRKHRVNRKRHARKHVKRNRRNRRHRSRR